MVSYTYNAGMGIWDIRGLAAEKETFSEKKKPPNGSSFYAMDTQQVFMWDAEHKEWIEQ